MIKILSDAVSSLNNIQWNVPKNAWVFKWKQSIEVKLYDMGFGHKEEYQAMLSEIYKAPDKATPFSSPELA